MDKPYSLDYTSEDTLKASLEAAPDYWPIWDEPVPIKEAERRERMHKALGRIVLLSVDDHGRLCGYNTFDSRNRGVNIQWDTPMYAGG